MGSPSSVSSACTTGVVRHAHADRASLRMLEPPRHLARRRQQERVPPRRPLANDAELPVVEPREMADLGEVAQHQREMVSLVDTADLPDAPRRDGVADVAAQRIARVGRVRDDAALAQDRRRLPDEARLRVGRMNLEELGHERCRGIRPAGAMIAGLYNCGEF